MSYQTITYDLSDGIAVITLNRPEAMNALNRSMRSDIQGAMARALDDAHCVVLTGTGRSFCAGQDLAEADGPEPVDFEAVLRDEYEPLLRAIHDCPLPTIAAVNGTAAGAGANLALAADVAIAAESAVFIQAFTRIGLMPDAGGTFWLPRQVGQARAMGAMLFAGPISARQAVDWGMIWECAPDDGFGACWRARARTLADGPLVAYRAIKQALRASPANGFEAQLALEAQLQGSCGATGDFAEGIAAFRQKRPARFTGR